MNLRKLILAAVLLTGPLVANANTQLTRLGALGNGDFGLVGAAFAKAQCFESIINFTLAGTSTLSGVVTPFRLQSAHWTLASSSGVLDGGALTLGKYSFADLTPGSYSFSIFGTSRAFGFYTASYRVAVAAVPELETWLMLAIGAGLVGFQLHRKQKALGQQALPNGSSMIA
jgi:hypothetical protein